ncbi:MAG TPA: SH3 domain-containing protein [Bacteroidales bacterium]|nr:SH3 domain-containing protein [Bacteroidales bacterium]
MKNKAVIFLIFALFSMTLTAQEGKEQAALKYANSVARYSEGKYQEALNGWMELYNSGYRSASLDYNIGNACFKLNNVPGSILFYERALLLKPGGEDIRYNLQIARSMVVDKLAEIPELFFVTWYNLISLSLSSNHWAIISLVSFILFLCFVSLYFYTRNYRLKVTGFWLGLLFIIISGSGFAFSSHNRSLVYNNDKAIIFTPVVNGKSSPDNSGNDLFVIHEGTKVSVGEKVGDWYEIRLSDGNKGWVSANCLTRL